MSSHGCTLDHMKRKPPKRGTKRMTFRLPVDVIKQLREQAEKEDRTMTTILVRAVSREVSLDARAST